MTLGLAAFGHSAADAVLAALAGAEAVGRGEIGGFGVFAAVDAHGRLILAETQRGGETALRADLSRQGLQGAVSGAVMAAVISSGPDRPVPLTQFLAADPALGLVTGHRLPNQPGTDGQPLNFAVLDRLRAGHAPQDALTGVIETNPEIDAGLVLVTHDSLQSANTRRVKRRPDCGEALQHRGSYGAACLHNSIRPVDGFAGIVVGIALDHLTEADGPLPRLVLRAGTPIRAGDGDRVHVDAAGAILLVETANPRILSLPGFAASAIYAGSEVLRDGIVIGHTVSEIRARVVGGRLEELPAESAIHYRADSA